MANRDGSRMLWVVYAYGRGGHLMSQHPDARLAPSAETGVPARACAGIVAPVRRALGRGCGSRRGAGSSCLHAAVDDFGRAAYAKLLPDERKGTRPAFMARRLVSFEGLGVAVATGRTAGAASSTTCRPGAGSRRKCWCKRTLSVSETAIA